eukprot:6205551-Prymnesium_polylepis.1
MAGYTLCDMLSSWEKHDWSSDSVTWVTPDHLTGQMGGSAKGWPVNHVTGDSRDYLSFWGSGIVQGMSGCCHNTLNDTVYGFKTFD